MKSDRRLFQDSHKHQQWLFEISFNESRCAIFVENFSLFGSISLKSLCFVKQLKYTHISGEKNSA